MEEIILTTSDGVQLYGDYYPAQKPNAPAVLLLHMMPATKDSWREFAEKLQKEGFQALAIDFRGHGKSTQKNGQTINYKDFNDTQQQEKIIDVETAVKFFTDKNIPLEKISLVGASIGANLAIQYMSEHHEIIAGTALSPGLDYKGIKTEEPVKKLTSAQEIFLAASEGDDDYSAQTAEKLYKITGADKKLELLKNAGHGTDMFKTNPELMDEIIEWLKNIYQ